MDVKPIPKPRSIGIERPVPAPRNVMPSSHLMQSTKRSSTSSKDSNQSEERDVDTNKLGYDVCDSGSSTNSSTDFFRNLGTSSRCLRDGISEKMTVKGRAMISSTKNASIRLEKSVKNLLTRRFTSPNQDELKCENASKVVGTNDEDRCVSMPPNDIFSTISFYSPLSSNLKTAQREEDLTNVHHSPPPPVYPPPPLPDESIYDELQSVTSGSTVGSNRYDTCSSTNSDQMDRDFPSETFDLFDFVQNQASDSDQSIHTPDSRLSNEKLDDSSKRLSRSESWTYREDYIPNQFESIEKLDRLSKLQDERELLSRGEKTPSIVSVPNSLYENWLPQKNDSQEEKLSAFSSMDSKTQTKSLLIEFDPFTSVDEENIYSNYENNDLMLLESLLATNESSNRAEDVIDKDNEDELNHIEDKSNIEIVPPEPPKRFDSLPKHEYDEVEMVERFDKTVTTNTEKSPALLPKLAHLAKRKQPALPPKDHSPSCGISAFSNDSDKLHESPKRTVNKEPIEEEPTSSPVIKNNEEYRGVSNVMQKLKKLKQDSAAHGIRPNVISLVRSRSKYLSKTRDSGVIGSITNNSTTSKNQSMKLVKPKVTATQNPMSHRGIVYSRSGINIEKMKDLNLRAAVLSDGKLSFYTDKNMNTLKEVVDIETVHSIHLLQDVKIVNNESVHCIALNGEGKTGVHVFYAKGPTERRIWAQRILENLTPVFPTKYTTEFTRAGWAYLKEGVTGSWFAAWLLLQQRTLVYTKTLEPVTFEYIDLRKARYIVLRDQEGPSAQSVHVSMVVVDAGGKGALHIAAPGSKECSAWKYALYQAATNSGPALNQQQITQDNVPVILEKCINFIYTHGIMSEGIYRRNGSNSAVVKLLESFRRDAWATQITKDLYSEHDVATALRRFLRDLSDPLFPTHINNQLCQISKLNVEDDRVTKYRKLLLDLDPVSSATLRKILAHLHCLSQQHGRNLMTIENLSAIWGPTLMHANGNNSEEWNKFETKVVGDLIRMYPKLYQLSSADLAKEAKILQVLEKHHVSNNQIVRNGPSGDLKIWIYILSKEGECVNVTIGPQKTAFDICRELADKACAPAHDLCLEECILAGALERPFHHNERVLETVARWGYWDSEDRKDNILVLRKDRLYKDIVPLIKPPMTMSGELKFADTKMKNFKSYLFEFSQAKLCCYKDKVYSTKLYEWKIEDVVWYLGHESKRNPHMGWSITFIVKNAKPTRCKEKPYFGNTLAGTSKVEQYKWLAAMLFGEHQMNLRPSAVNLMDP